MYISTSSLLMRKENEENPVIIKHININSLNLSGQLQVFSRFFGTSFLPCHLYRIVLKKWMSLFINTAGTWHLICITGSYWMDLYDEIRVLPLFNRSAFFLLLLNFKGLSFFVVYKKWIKHADSKNKRRRDKKKKNPQDKINHVHDELLLLYISEWIKINQVLNVDFQPLKKPFFFSFFDSVFMICYAWSNKVSQVWESAQLTAG